MRENDIFTAAFRSVYTLWKGGFSRDLDGNMTVKNCFCHQKRQKKKMVWQK